MFTKSKEELFKAKRKCVTEALHYVDVLIDGMLSYLDQLSAIDESNLTPARKSIHRSRIIRQAQKELMLHSSKTKELFKTAKSIE